MSLGKLVVLMFALLIIFVFGYFLFIPDIVCITRGHDYAVPFGGSAAPGYVECCNNVYVDNLKVNATCEAVK